MSLSSKLWPLKIASKMMLSRLPVGYGIWKKLGLFEWGAMDDPSYPIKVFEKHKALTFSDVFPKNWVGLEIGPGDSVASGMIAWSYGASKTYLVDAGAFVSTDVTLYKNISTYLSNQGYKTPDLSSAKSFQDILSAHNITYFTQGLESLKTLPDDHVDFLWSHSVLEHVRAHEFGKIMIESARILKPKTGRISHNVDLMDHLDNSIHNMQFSTKTWESNFWAKSGFYTNRLRASQIMRLVEDANLKITEVKKGQWDKLPVPRKKLAKEFQNLSDDDLLTRTLHVLAQK